MDVLTKFTASDALRNFRNRGGTVQLDMRSHMISGGGSVFTIDDFANDIGAATRGLALFHDG
jgi:hypothetical protein